ncbi:DUF2493 domain-containing protein [Caulobacter sp. 17J65-9]|uniref:DUF2493 domain-containing protein n=1 Tax=Caulobacter sp. 17J65-9 TaxID=2709382 RepID=UPI0013CB6E0C|nr:DUF2493 domain-containing protein [Caulobacter sp. 17J65-9]NEX91170.1 DUF2493 domain-containing protein [Caulobacter sp. 17J65-9]
MQTASLPGLHDRQTSFEAIAAAVGDHRPHPTEDALGHLGAAVMTEVVDLLSETALEDYMATVCEAVIGAFHSAATRVEREADRARAELSQAHRDFDGTEIADQELQDLTRRAHAADVAVMALEQIRNTAAAAYTTATGEVWTPWKGSVKPNRVTGALIEARDAIRASKARKHAVADPGVAVVAFRGSPKADTQADAARIFDALNWAHERFPDMTLATTGAPGAEKVAIKWAQQKGVRLVLAKADFDRYARSAPFRANDQMLELDPVLCLTLDDTLNAERGSHTSPFGPSLNLGQKAAEKGIRHVRITSKAA